MTNRSVLLLCGLLVIGGCQANDTFTPLDDVPLGSAKTPPQHPMDLYLAQPREKSRTIVRVPTSDDCPGRVLDESNDVLCLVEHPEEWRPFEFNGGVYFLVPLADG